MPILEGKNEMAPVFCSFLRTFYVTV